MGLIDRLLERSVSPASGGRRVFARVLLDDAGHVQAVQLKRGCGDPELDEKAILALQRMRYPAPRIGSKTSRRWHDVVYSID